MATTVRRGLNRSAGSGSHDLDEIIRLETRTSYQSAVDSRLGHEPAAIGSAHTSAVLNASGGRYLVSIQIAKHGPAKGVGISRLVGSRGLTGPNRPDRLVCHHDTRHTFHANSRQ